MLWWLAISTRSFVKSSGLSELRVGGGGGRALSLRVVLHSGWSLSHGLGNCLCVCLRSWQILDIL